VLALAMTWPLGLDVGTRLPYDLGDPLLNCWILAWQIRQFTRLLHGDVAVLGEWWHGNIFSPASHTIGLSEGLVVPALLGWPVLGLTGNVILTYNLLFLGSLALSGLLMFLFVRELTEHVPAAWIAGLLFAFAPVRFDHGSHLQVQFACWMPLVLLQLERLARTGRTRNAVGAGLALGALNLSNGYYMFFFGPWVAAWSLFALWRHGHLRAVDRWRGLVVATATGLAVTLPAMTPYLALRAQVDIGRPREWVEQYSATAASWVTATPWLRLWGWMDWSPRPENYLFPGAMPIVGVAVAILLWRRLPVPDRRVGAFALGAAIAGIWWSFGPTITLAGWALPGLYLPFFQWVPGFDSLRAPPRVAIIVALWTAVLGGLAVAGVWRHRWLHGRARSGQGIATGLLSALVLVDVTVVPMRMHDVLHAPHYRQQSADIPPDPTTAPVARMLARLPATAVLVELPFGALPLEVRYMYTSIGHWRRLVNGYSGAFPPDYLRWKRAFERLPDGGAEAEVALRECGATHVVLHGDAFGVERTGKLEGWLRGLGARPVGRSGDTVVYRLPPGGQRRHGRG
jgi:hypothetical protein